MREILLATGNPGKAKEMREILSGRDHGRIRWRHLSEFADRHWPEPVEGGATFLANAEIKARHYARLSGMWTIADDSGLVVDVLGGEPGVRSARYAGEPKSDSANNALLIRKLAGVLEARRTARFCCAVVLAGVEHPARLAAASCRSPEDAKKAGETPAPQAISETTGPQQVEVLAEAEGTIEGRIVDEARGTNGFGYDPHFFVPAFGMTTAEMEPDRKHGISHRGQALRLLRDKLADLID